MPTTAARKARKHRQTQIPNATDRPFFDASRWIVSNDPEEHVERVGYYVGLGFRHLVFHALNNFCSSSF